MSNPFSFQQQPCLDFLNCDTPQSNSLLQGIIMKEQVVQQNNFAYHFMENEMNNSQTQMRAKMQIKQRASRPKTKQKKKVFYRDKMAELMHEQSYIKPQYNYVDFGQFQKGKSPISRQQQLKRNRQSAKQSRQRKKQYVQTLQQKNKAHQKHIAQLSQRLRQTELERDRLKQSNNTHIQSFNDLKSECYDKLSTMLQATRTKQQKRKQIDLCITELRQKFGSAGKQRINLIIQNLLTDFQKYFINSAISDSGIFTDMRQAKQTSIHKIDVQIGTLLDLNQLKKNSLVKIYKDRFKKQAMLFNSICQQLYQSFSSLINQSSILENIFNDMRKQFQPQQIARLILYFQQNKYRKDLRKMRNQWYGNFKKNEDEIVDSMRKMTKRFEY